MSTVCFHRSAEKQKIAKKEFSSHLVYRLIPRVFYLGKLSKEKIEKNQEK
jgi:hypothetical protein